MRVILTGASGFLGNHAERRLLSDGHTLLTLSSDGGLSQTDSRMSGWLRAPDLQSAVSRFRPDACLFIGAADSRKDDVQSMDDLVSGNVLLPARISAAAIEAGCQKIIHMGSSWQEVGGEGFNPFDLYSATKEAVVSVLGHWARNRGISVTQLQMFDTYGPNDKRKKLLNSLIDSCITGERIDLSPGEQALHLVHIRDVVEAICQLLKEEHTEPELLKRSLTSDQPITIKGLVSLLVELGEMPNVNFGAREYRNGEIMLPKSQYPRPKDWLPTISLRDGILECLTAKRQDLNMRGRT